MASHAAVERFLHAVETATIPACDAWSADATLDATVPNWRLRASGPDAIRAEYARWFADPGHFDELRRYPVGDGAGEVVEYTLSWIRERRAARCPPHAPADVWPTASIVADTVMCGGRWPAGLLAEMEAAGA